MAENDEKTLMPEMDTGGDEEEEEIEEQGVIDRIVNLFVDPASLFKYLSIRPDFWTPWIVVGLILAVMTAVAFPVTYELQWPAQENALRARGMDEDKITEKAEKYHSQAAKTISMVIGIAAVAIFIPVGWLVSGGALFLLSLIQGLETSFKRVYSVVAYSSIVGILGSGVLDKIIKLTKGGNTLDNWNISKVSLAAFLPEGLHRSIQTVASAIDPFFIWSLILMVIGLTFANRCKRKSAILTVVIYFIVMLIFMAGFGLIMQKYMPGSGGGNVEVRVG